jgi:hypothetical protein
MKFPARAGFAIPCGIDEFGIISPLRERELQLF